MTSAEFLSDIADLRADLREVFDTHEAPEAMRKLGPDTPAPADRAKVVVVGDVGAGKTSLINAVLDRPQLLPVQPTGCYFAVGGGRPETARVHLSDGQVHPIDPQRLSRWLQPDSPDEAVVDHVEVLIDDPRLTRMTLFDTPGVNGLDTAAAMEVTLNALEHATALVFVCSALATISIAERKFLAQAAARIDHIVFVLSQIDRTGDLGKANLRENEEKVRAQFEPGRFGKLAFLAFDAHLAADGAAGDKKALQKSGIIALRERLDGIAARHTAYIQLNPLREVREAISVARSLVVQRRKALQNANAAPELARVTAQLEDLRERKDTWRSTLTEHLEEAHHEVRHDCNHRIKRLRAEYQGRLATRKKAQIRDLEADFLRDLATLHTDIDTDLRRRVTELAAQLLIDIGDEADIADIVERLPPLGESPPDYIDERTAGLAGGLGAPMALQTAYLGSMMWQNLTKAAGSAGLIGAHAASAASTMGVSAGFGVAWWLLQKFLRNRAADLVSLSGWINSALNETKYEMTYEIERGFRKASRRLQDAVDEAIGEALKTTSDTRVTLTREGSEQRKAVEDFDRAVEALKTRWDRLHESLTDIAKAPLELPTAEAPATPTP